MKSCVRIQGSSLAILAAGLAMLATPFGVGAVDPMGSVIFNAAFPIVRLLSVALGLLLLVTSIIRFVLDRDNPGAVSGFLCGLCLMLSPIVLSALGPPPAEVEARRRADANVEAALGSREDKGGYALAFVTVGLVAVGVILFLYRRKAPVSERAVAPRLAARRSAWPVRPYRSRTRSAAVPNLDALPAPQRLTTPMSPEAPRATRRIIL